MDMLQLKEDKNETTMTYGRMARERKLFVRHEDINSPTQRPCIIVLHMQNGRL
jgi:hypothetical protein